MLAKNSQSRDLRAERVGCRPRPLRSFFNLRYQGSLPGFAWMKPLQPVIAIASPLAQTVMLAGLPTILLIFLFQALPGLKQPHQPEWVRALCFTVLVISCPLSVWWCWFSPRADFVTLSERHLSWRVSLSRWEWFRSRGCLAVAELASFFISLRRL